MRVTRLHARHLPVCPRSPPTVSLTIKCGGNAPSDACLPELAELFDGVELCDSFCVNCHKKLLCPFDLAALYVADRGPLLAALSLTPEYLKNSASDSGAVVDYEHWQLGLGRRFRALKLWCVLSPDSSRMYVCSLSLGLNDTPRALNCTRFVLRRFGAQGIRHHVRRGMQVAY